jgi:hypothetical protein
MNHEKKIRSIGLRENEHPIEESFFDVVSQPREYASAAPSAKEISWRNCWALMIMSGDNTMLSDVFSNITASGDSASSHNE